MIDEDNMDKPGRSTAAFNRLILRTAGLSNASDDASKNRLNQEMAYALSIQDETMEGFSEKSPPMAAAFVTVGCCRRLMDFAKDVPPDQTLNRILECGWKESLELIRSAAAYLSSVLEAAEEEKEAA